MAGGSGSRAGLGWARRSPSESPRAMVCDGQEVMFMNATPVERPEKIERLARAVYPSFAMLAGMELDVFTPLKDGPLTGLQIAATLGIDPIRLHPLLYALVAADLLTVDGERF